MLSWVGLAIDAVQGPGGSNDKLLTADQTATARQMMRSAAGGAARGGAAAALRAICAVGEISRDNGERRRGDERGGCCMVVAHSVSGDLMS